MRKLVLFALALIIYSCSNKKDSTNSYKDSFQKIPTKISKSKIDVLNENIQYIGFIDKFYFYKKNEIYTELYFKNDEINNDEYEKIVKLADSLIYEDDENSRQMFPISLAPKYFDMRGLSKLKIYDNNNKFVSNADFVRVEYLNQNISPVFIAVYKTNKKIETDSVYGISNHKATFEQINYTITTDSILTQRLLTKLNEKKPNGNIKYNGTHINFINSNKVLSIINSINFTYIILSTRDDFKVLYKSSETENFIELKVIPIIKNKFPCILTRNVRPETDVIWDKLLYYDGTKYCNSNRQRIN